MTDAGVPFFDVADQKAVKEAEVVVSKASDQLRTHLPPGLLKPFLGLEYWQWIALPVLVVLVALCTLGLSRFSLFVIARINRRAANDRMVVSLRSPVRLFWLSLISSIAIQLMALPASLEGGLMHLVRIVLGVAFFWGLVRAVTVWADGFLGSSWAQSRPGSRAMVNLASRIAKFALIALAVLASLSELGYSVTSVLAGLGLGGLALALGAQKTLENVFGAFALAVDQPIREGEYVTVEGGVSGTVENIGLRSTRIRTVDRTMVTIPNGKLADLRLETYAPRDRIRLAITLRLAYGAPSAKLKALRDAIEKRLLAEPKLAKDTVTVRYGKVAESWLELDLAGYYDTRDFEEYRTLREALLLEVLGLIEFHGASMGLPATVLTQPKPS